MICSKTKNENTEEDNNVSDFDSGVQKVMLLDTPDGPIHHYTLFDGISHDLHKYIELIRFLKCASPEDILILEINNGGGSVDVCLTLCSAITESEAHVVAKCTGIVASAAATIAAACDSQDVDNDCSILVHCGSFGASGKTNDTVAYSKHVEQVIRRMLRRYFTGVLTEEEITSVEQGKEFWMFGDEFLERLMKKHNAEIEEERLQREFELSQAEVAEALDKVREAKRKRILAERKKKQ